LAAALTFTGLACDPATGAVPGLRELRRSFLHGIGFLVGQELLVILAAMAVRMMAIQMAGRRGPRFLFTQRFAAVVAYPNPQVTEGEKPGTMRQ